MKSPETEIKVTTSVAREKQNAAALKCLWCYARATEFEAVRLGVCLMMRSEKKSIKRGKVNAGPFNALAPERWSQP